MPSYDFVCDRGHRFEGRSTIAHRTEPRPCRSDLCPGIANAVFTLSDPLSIAASPVNSQTRWADVAPVDPVTGQVYNTPGEAYASGDWQPHDRSQGDSARREVEAQNASREAGSGVRAMDRAWKRVQADDVPVSREHVPD